MSFCRPWVFVDGLFRKARKGEGWMAIPRRVTTSTDSNQTISADAILGGIYTRTGTNTSRTDTTITGTALAVVMTEMDIGGTYMLLIANMTATNPLTIAGGVDISASGNLIVPALTSRWMLFEKTGATTFTMIGL